MSLRVAALAGLRTGDWLALLRANRFRLAPSTWGDAALVTLLALRNSWLVRRERRRLGAGAPAAPVAPPLFVLGHWRSGTTLLHGLLAADPRLAAPSMYEVVFPHHFGSTRGSPLARWLARRVPPTRAADAVAQSLDAPYEDEFALLALSLRSPYLGWAFPRRAAAYARDLDRPSDERRWRARFADWHARLARHHGRRLVFKSPPHTARVPLLLGLFPGARFVHVARDPYAVFQSTRRLHVRVRPRVSFQGFAPDGVDAEILATYQALYASYFDHRDAIPRGHLHELRFEALERDPVGELRRLYAALELGDFEPARPAVERHVAALAGYRKGEHGPLAAAERARVAREWGPWFERLGYSS